MTIPAQIPVTSSVANGVTTSFPYTFKILDAADLSVSVDDIVITTGFNITGVGEENGGNVIFDVAPANGLKVIRFLNPVLSRVIDYQQFGDFLAPTVNGDFDRLWLAMQYINQSITRSIKLPVDVVVGQEITEDTADRANKVITFDASGNVALKAGTELIHEVDDAVNAALAAAAGAEASASAADTSKDEAEAAALAASTTPVAAPTHAASSKTTPDDADEIPLIDSADSWSLKKLTWVNLKTALKTYFDSLQITAAIDTGFASVVDNATATPAWIIGKVKALFNVTGTAPMYACRAWVNFNGTGTVSIRASGNVSSITDNGVGDYTIGFTTPMPNANYSVVGIVSNTSQAQVRSLFTSESTPQTSSSVRVLTTASNSGATTAQDPVYVMASIFR